MEKLVGVYMCVWRAKTLYNCNSTLSHIRICVFRGCSSGWMSVKAWITECFSLDSLNSVDPDIGTLSLSPPALCVVGNKCDLTGEREVPKDRGETFAHQLGALFTETSAAENMGMLVYCYKR